MNRKQLAALHTDTLITVRTRTGSEIHQARAGSSKTECGVWLRTHATNMHVDRPATCERCAALVAERAKTKGCYNDSAAVARYRVCFTATSLTVSLIDGDLSVPISPISDPKRWAQAVVELGARYQMDARWTEAWETAQGMLGN